MYDENGNFLGNDYSALTFSVNMINQNNYTDIILSGQAQMTSQTLCHGVQANEGDVRILITSLSDCSEILPDEFLPGAIIIWKRSLLKKGKDKVDDLNIGICINFIYIFREKTRQGK